MATPPATRTTPTSTPCCGPTRTSSSRAPKRRRITCSNSSAVAFPVRCWLTSSLSVSLIWGSRRRSRPPPSATRGRPRRDPRAAATAPITAMPAAPAASTSRALPASIPPIPTTGSAVAPRDGAEPFQTHRDGFRFGRGRPDRDAQVVGARHLGHPRLLGAHHADAQDALRSEPSPCRPRIVVLAHVRPRGAASRPRRPRGRSPEGDARVAAHLDQRRRERQQLVVGELRRPKLDRRGTALDRRRRDSDGATGPMSEVTT